jgi:hypothetical protein
MEPTPRPDVRIDAGTTPVTARVADLQSARQLHSATPRLTRVDAAYAIVLALMVLVFVLTVTAKMDRRFLMSPVGNDVWFESDIPTVADNILHRWSDQTRNAHHPLFPLTVTSAAYLLRWLGLSDATVLRTLSMCAGCAWVIVLYLLLRAIVITPHEAGLFALLACVTAASMFWLPVPETYPWGSVSILTALAVCAWDPHGRWWSGWYVAVAAFALSMTTTNWMAGLATVFARHQLRRAAQIAANSFCLVILLWAIQRYIYPTAEFFIGYLDDRRFLFTDAAGGPLRALRVLLFHSVIMPGIQIVNEPNWGSILSVQRAPLSTSGLWSALATLLWLPMLGLAARSLVASNVDRGLRAALAATLAGQILMHLAYGDETFLYSLHVAPLLVVAAAAGTRCRLRLIVVGLAAALVIALAINNVGQLATALRFFEAGGRAS